MSTETKKSSSSLTVIRNMLIGVTTTVLASAAVYYLGFQRSGDEELKKKKDATANAWHSIADYVRYGLEKNKGIACYSCDVQEMKKELLRGLDQNITSLNNLKEDKNIDEKMISVIDRVTEQFKEQKELFTLYYDSTAALMNYPAEERAPLLSGLQQYYFGKQTRIQTRDTLEIGNLLKDINRKYETKLAQKEAAPVLSFTPTALSRKWKIECTSEIEFEKDGTVTLTEEQEKFKGKWTIADKLLLIDLDNGQTFKYRILELSEKMLVFVEETSGMVLGACPL